MKQIVAKNGDVCCVSDEDYDLVKDMRWYTSTYASKRGGKYFYAQIDGKTVYLHRLLLSPPAGVEVDHINGDASDNRRENLRLATKSQNCANRTDYNPKSGFRGVYNMGTIRRPWGVYITTNGKQLNGGRFSDKLEAASKYNQLAIQHFGEFAVLNNLEGK